MIVKSRKWKDCDHDTYYYYDEENGLIVGQIHKMAHTKIWISKVIHGHNDEKFLGQYISYEFALMAVENYWLVQERTLIDG